MIAGADGCKAGWVLASTRADGSNPTIRVVPHLATIFGGPDVPDFLAIDIPIGLPDRGARECDVMARRLLGRGRGSSVFPTPIRPVLDSATYEAAKRIGRTVEGKALSIQGWAIVPKIREVDDALRADPRIRSRVREVHPEYCFYVLAGNRPMKFGKKSAEGRRERVALLDPLFGGRVSVEIEERRRAECEADDVVDAFVALWTARRWRDGVSTWLPGSEPPRDRFAVPMEMVA